METDTNTPASSALYLDFLSFSLDCLVTRLKNGKGGGVREWVFSVYTCWTLAEAGVHSKSCRENHDFLERENVTRKKKKKINTHTHRGEEFRLT